MRVLLAVGSIAALVAVNLLLTRRRARISTAEPTERIFVCIVSVDEPLDFCIDAAVDVRRKAAVPQRVAVCVVQCLKRHEHPRDVRDSPTIRVHTTAKATTLRDARRIAMEELYGGEEFVMMLGERTQVMDDWDVLAQRQLGDSDGILCVPTANTKRQCFFPCLKSVHDGRVHIRHRPMQIQSNRAVPSIWYEPHTTFARAVVQRQLAIAGVAPSEILVPTEPVAVCWDPPRATSHKAVRAVMSGLRYPGAQLGLSAEPSDVEQIVKYGSSHTVRIAFEKIAQRAQKEE